MGVKLTRNKPRVPLLSFIYRLAKVLPLSHKQKFKLALDLEWIFDRLSHEYSFRIYDLKNHPVRVHTITFLKKLINSEHSVLDLGCHAGELTYLISTIAGQTTGVDYNEIWINEAKKEFGNKENLQFYHGEALEYLSQHPVKYDILILSHILEHLDDPKEFLLRFKSFFKYIYIELPDFDRTYLNQYRLDMGLSLIYMDSDHISEFDRDELEKLLGDCEIEIIRAEYRHGVQRLWCRA